MAILKWRPQNVNTKNLNKVIHSSIGPFYLVVIHNDTIKIYCSCSSPGLLYIQKNNKLIFSNNENKFYQNYFDKTQINEDELISHIISHPIFRRVPFKSLFNNISRCINGSYIEISKDLQTNTKLFIISNPEKFNAPELASCEFSLIIIGDCNLGWLDHISSPLTLNHGLVPKIRI